MSSSTPIPFPLTPSQLTHYTTHGYLILPATTHNLIPPALLQQYTLEIRTLPLTNGKWMPYDELLPSGDRQIMRTEHFADYHSGFSSLLHSPSLRSILAQCAGAKDMHLFKEKINYKSPGGNGFGAHLDAPAYEHIPGAAAGNLIEHTTANIAVDPATRANGCIEVVRGSHRMNVPLAQGGRIDPVWEAQQEWVPVELAPGDLLVFGSRLAHRSARNDSDTPRASVYATYTDVCEGGDLRERYYSHRREMFPPDHERIPGKDYNAGVQRYAFAAPFTPIAESETRPIAAAAGEA